MHSIIYCCFLGCMQDTSCLRNCVGGFHPYEIHFTSLFINILSHHLKYLHDSLFNIHETHTETGLTRGTCYELKVYLGGHVAN
jgi:hypothetical protein